MTAAKSSYTLCKDSVRVFLSVPDERLNDLLYYSPENKQREREYARKCANCTTPPTAEKALKACARCRKARYCSVECQIEDWGEHKRVCRPRTWIQYFSRWSEILFFCIISFSDKTNKNTRRRQPYSSAPSRNHQNFFYSLLYLFLRSVFTPHLIPVTDVRMSIILYHASKM